MYKATLLVFITLFNLNCNGQFLNQNNYLLTISPAIDKKDNSNLLIIEALNNFLQTKNASLSVNKYWLESDFEKFVFPYFDIFYVEKSSFGENFYLPTLTEIIPTKNSSQKIIKISFIGHKEETGENYLKYVYNIIANIKPDSVLFSKYLDYITEHWRTIEKKNLIYKISPNKLANEIEIAKQCEDIEKICAFFKCDPIPITYYSCINPKELFEIKGFDYCPMMYFDKYGGMTEYGNFVFSGNNSELYTHEILHIYTGNLFPNINKFIDEGLATLLAGSGLYDYKWHREKLAKFIKENENFNFALYTDPYERFYFENETSIPYLTSALILERTLQLYGKDKLMEVLNAQLELWKILETTGLTQKNINEELRKQLLKPLSVFPF